MRKQQFSIKEIQHNNGSYSIVLFNVRLHKEIFKKIRIIIEHFTVGSNLFFGNYKLDGINILSKEHSLFLKEIQLFFQSNGKYLELVKSKANKQELVISYAPNNKNTYYILEKLFDCYLETICFCPKIDWQTFNASYNNYMNINTKDYVINGYTDFLFSYIDSGDFYVSFNPKTHNPEYIREQINRILDSNASDDSIS